MHIKFRRRGITQKKAHNIQNTAKVLDQEQNANETCSEWEGVLSYLLSIVPYDREVHLCSGVVIRLKVTHLLSLVRYY